MHDVAKLFAEARHQGKDVCRLLLIKDVPTQNAVDARL